MNFFPFNSFLIINQYVVRPMGLYVQIRAIVSMRLCVVMGRGTVGMVQTNNAVSTLFDQLPLTIVYTCIFV